MRWQELFADLEHQAWSLDRSDLEAEVADRTRAEVARTTLVGRLQAAVGVVVALRLLGGRRVRGELLQVGADWLLLGSPAEHLVPVRSLVLSEDLPISSIPPGGGSVVGQRLPLVVALRALAVRRAVARFELIDGTVVVGTPDRVGADFVDVAVHDRDEAPRRSAVRSRVTISASAIAVVVRDSAAWD